MPADFRVEGVDRVPLYASNNREKRVAVAPQGTTLRGDLEIGGGDCWLCIDLTEQHPLRIPNERESVWVHAGERCQPPPLAWKGVKSQRTVGPMLDLQWERPFACTGDVTYRVRMQPDGTDDHWDMVWQGELGEDFGSHRIEVTIEWPYQVSSAKVVINAVHGQLDLTSAATAVCCSPEHALGSGTKNATAVLTTVGGLGPQMSPALSLETRADMLARAVPYRPRKLPYSRKRHVVLRQQLPAAERPVGPFSKAVVMGLYHSCTTAMAEELQRCFDIPVTNKLITNSREKLWKHRVHYTRFDAADDKTLVILMVKDPFFWLQSVGRNLYEIHPVAKDEQGCFQDLRSRTFADLFNFVEHDRVIYPDAVALWSDAMSTYFDDDIYPASASVVVRAEDFLFRFDAVMDELGAAWGLGTPERGTPRQRRTKAGARSRDQALDFYSDPANRALGFDEGQLRQVSGGLDAEILDLLGYGDNAVTEWAA
mmetsp:Transcript_62581/g.182993  ORF Transcript_62581/g.182993 Transcript_62581/m.182993 type:complete len:483 (-) Transcript_62581:151-1599(-)